MTTEATIAILKLVLAAAVSTAIVAEDLWHRRIPNLLSALLLLIGMLSATLSHGWKGLTDGLLGAIVAFVVFLIPYLMGGLGGGDVKLMAGCGALTGLQGVVPALVLVAIAGTVTAVLYLAWGRLRGTAVPVAIPYAPSILAGSLLVTFSQIGGK